MTLGRYPKLSLADARAVVAKFKQKIERGEDPKVEIKETRKNLSIKKLKSQITLKDKKTQLSSKINKQQIGLPL